MASSNVTTLKRSIFVLSIVSAGLGCWSHFNSTWTKSICLPTYPQSICMKLYEICDLPGAEKCPKIELERTFVGVVIVCFVLSTASLFGSIKNMDALYHDFAAVFLVAGAALYFVSIEQITELVAGVNKLEGINFRRPEKLAAAVVAVVQGVLCEFTARFLRSKPEK